MPAQEILAECIKVQGHHGVPMTYTVVGQATAENSSKPVGEIWPKWFCKHHPDFQDEEDNKFGKSLGKALN